MPTGGFTPRPDKGYRLFRTCLAYRPYMRLLKIAIGIMQMTLTYPSRRSYTCHSPLRPRRASGGTRIRMVVPIMPSFRAT